MGIETYQKVFAGIAYFLYPCTFIFCYNVYRFKNYAEEHSIPWAEFQDIYIVLASATIQFSASVLVKRMF